MSANGSAARIAYFINQYPGISHSFIRREIQALERAGVEVLRFAIRPALDKIISEEDRREAELTRHIVGCGKARLLASMARQFLQRPLSTIKAFFKALRLGRCSEAGLARHFLYFGEALVLADWMRASGVRHVHAHFGTNAAMIAMLAAEIGDRQYSMTVHGPEEFEKPALISLREKVEGSAFTVAISKFGAAQLKKLAHPEDWVKIRVVHCGVEPDFYAGREVGPSSERKLVCVGRLCAEKGQVDLVRAFAGAALKVEGASLSLIGDGPMREEIEKAVTDLGLGSSVRLVGWKTPEEVTSAILSSRAFVLPSYAEGLPVSIMEALTLQRPVISTYIAGIPELVRDGENGWLVPAGDVEAIERAIVEALSADDEQLARMGAAGRRAAIADHDIDAEAKKLRELFREVYGMAS